MPISGNTLAKGLVTVADFGHFHPFVKRQYEQPRPEQVGINEFAPSYGRSEYEIREDDKGRTKTRQNRH
jgi:hypothetical protein